MPTKLTQTGAEIQELLNKIEESSTALNYSELVKLRDAGKLRPGQLYRITDYVTTTSQENTRSQGHQFDVIVLAITADRLAERAWAYPHKGDTYFIDSNLSAWQIWYCLANDTSRFAWADITNGKGVIYRMIDEWNNDCPYDFKNIMFRHPHDSANYPYYYYTFSYIYSSGDCRDKSILQIGQCRGNVMSSYATSPTKVALNEIVFLSKSNSDFVGNNFKPNCYKISFSEETVDNSFGVDCYVNEFKGACRGNTFEYSVRYNTFGSDFRYCFLGANCQSNVFGASCYSITLGTNCSSNKFGDSCRNTKLGNNSSDNEFGSNCRFNTFGESCQYNNLGLSCRYLVLGNGCNHISVGSPYCYYIEISSGAQYIEFTNAETASVNQLVKGYRVGNVQGASSNLLQIAVERNRDYETTVAKDSAGNVKQFCIADIVLQTMKTYVDSNKIKGGNNGKTIQQQVDDLAAAIANIEAYISAPVPDFNNDFNNDFNIRLKI